MIPKGCTPKNWVKGFAIMKATSQDTKVIPDMMPVSVRDWIFLAFRLVGNTALTFLTAFRINPPRRAPAEHKLHQGLPLTRTAHRTGRHASSSGATAARPGSLLGPGRQAEHTDHVSHLVNPLRLSGYPGVR